MINILEVIYCGCDFITKIDKLGTELNKLVKKLVSRFSGKKI